MCICRMLQLSPETTASLKELLLSALPLQHSMDDQQAAKCILACLADVQDVSASKLLAGMELLQTLLPQLSASTTSDQASPDGAPRRV